MFTVVKGDQHPTDMAGLCGARLVTSTEVQTGKTWNEVKIKALTGGDKIRARYMRQDFFTYMPQFTLIIAGNNKPALQSIDVAMRRRMHLIPFLVTIPNEERDPRLAEKLKAEWPGILWWMIQGSVEWHKDGLKPPQSVVDATDEYFKSEDAIGAWLEEKTSRNKLAFETTTALYQSWSDYAKSVGEEPGRMKQFRTRVESLDYLTPKRTKFGRGFDGILIKSTYNEESE
jgi:putative DNA primase/helicase